MGKEAITNRQGGASVADTFANRFATVLDAFIGIFSPQTALNRKGARLQLRLAQGYEAGRPWRNSANWQPADGRADVIDTHYRTSLRAKARYLERNSEIVNSIINAYLRNVVGKGFNLQVRTKDARWNAQVEALFREWSRPGACDITGTYSLTEILSTIIRRKMVDGGILLLKCVDEKAPIPFKLQLREVEDLDANGLISSEGGNAIKDGVEVDGFGRPLAYYLRQYDPVTYAVLKSIRVPAENAYFLFDKVRPSQVREISRFARTLDKINDLDEFFQAVIFAQKITSAVAIFITNDNYTGGIGRSALQGGQDGKKAEAGTRIDPGSITRLAPGEKVQTLVPVGQANELTAFNLAMMRQISSGQGLSYEQVTRDVSQVNYSSARQNLLEDWKAFIYEQQYLIEHFLDDVFAEVVKSAVLNGRLKAPQDFWAKTEKYLRHFFVGQSMPWIDPYKEALANKIMFESCQMTLQEYCAKNGKDYEETLAQILKEHSELQALKEQAQASISPPTV